MNFDKRMSNGCGYFISGHGEALYVMISGWGTPYSLADMYNLAELLSKEARVIIIDRRGYASEDSDVSSRTFKTVCDEIVSVIEKENPKNKAIIVGHSLGGSYALSIALDYPQIVKRVLALDMLPYTGRMSSVVYGFNYIPGYIFRLMRAMKVLDLMSDDTISKLLKIQTVPDSVRSDALTRTRTSLYNQHVMNELKYMGSFIDRIRNGEDVSEIPVSLVISEKTMKLTEKSLPTIKGTFHNARIVNVGKSSHYVHHDKLNAVYETIIDTTK